MRIKDIFSSLTSTFVPIALGLSSATSLPILKFNASMNELTTINYSYEKEFTSVNSPSLHYFICSMNIFTATSFKSYNSNSSLFSFAILLPKVSTMI